MNNPDNSDPARPRLGFIGVGVMGLPMATNLLKAGYECTVFDLNPVPLQALAGLGARRADSPADLAAHSDILISMLVNDTQLAATLFEPHLAAPALKPGSVVIGMSTMSMAGVRQIAARLKPSGLEYLDAPVSGGEKGATGATLSIMVGGSPELLARCRPVLQTLGSNIYHIGPQPGDGQAVKMINQLMVCVHTAVAAEALTFGEKLGLDKAMLLDIIRTSAGNSWILGDRGPRMVAEDFSPPKSALTILAKDIGLVMETADNLKHPLALGSLAHQLFKMAAVAGLGPLDDAVMIKLMQNLAGMNRSNEP